MSLKLLYRPITKLSHTMSYDMYGGGGVGERAGGTLDRGIGSANTDMICDADKKRGGCGERSESAP